MSQQDFQLGSQSVNNCSGISVTVNSGPSAGCIPRSAVTIRSIVLRTQQLIPRQQPIAKVLLKTVNKKKKNAGAKTFTLRNVDSSIINTCSQMKALIRDQLRNDITEKNFDIGYLQSSTVISIRNKDDLAEISSMSSCSFSGLKVTTYPLDPRRKGQGKLTQILTWTVMMKTIHLQRKTEYRRLLRS